MTNNSIIKESENVLKVGTQKWTPVIFKNAYELYICIGRKAFIILMNKISNHCLKNWDGHIRIK